MCSIFTSPLILSSNTIIAAGNEATKERDIAPIIGGSLGAVFGALLVILVALIVCCCCWRGCCCCLLVGGRKTTTDDYDQPTPLGDNPTYFAGKDMASPSSTKSLLSARGGGYLYPNPSYEVSEQALEGSDPPLPPRNGNIPNDFHHYDTIPALADPPSNRTSGAYSQLAHSNIGDNSLDNVELENWNKADEVTTSTFQETRAENPYTTAPGTRTNLPPQVEEPIEKTPEEVDAVTMQVPSSHESPYGTKL